MIILQVIIGSALVYLAIGVCYSAIYHKKVLKHIRATFTISEEHDFATGQSIFGRATNDRIYQVVAFCAVILCWLDLVVDPDTSWRKK